MTQYSSQDRPDDAGPHDAGHDPTAVTPGHEAAGDVATRDDAASRGGLARKERVLHTRVPAVLEQELKHIAESLRMPVSNVVRAILEDAVAAVDRVGRRAEGEVHRAANRLAEQRERLRTIAGTRASEARDRPDQQDQGPASQRPPAPRSGVDARPDARAAGVARSEPSESAARFEGVIGFQPLMLTRAAVCALCGAALRKGTEAFLGVRATVGPQVLIGRECLPTEDEPIG
ncbi:MAG: hypothetical protein MUF54_05305 [Polyangiaceae bacterium]|nr:hypothetical protein [Polyangiaceae bacterium]